MKYNIVINQFAAIEMCLKSDIIDLAIYDFICSYSQCDKCVKTIVDGVTYFWISPKLIIEELPILRISTPRGIAKRLDNLIEDGLLERCPENKSLKQTYFKLGCRYSELKFSTWNNGSNSTWNNRSKYNTIDIDNTIKKESIKKKDETLSLALPYSSKEFVDVWYTLKSMPKWRRKSQSALQMSLKKLGKYDEPFAIKLMESAIAGEYQGVVFADTDKKYEQWKRTNPQSGFNKKADDFDSMLRLGRDLGIAGLDKYSRTNGMQDENDIDEQ